MINISSIRLGFANNSSSTHSILLRCPVQERIEDEVSDQEFGWSWFHLKSANSKAVYLAQTLAQNLNMSPDLKKIVIQELCGVPYNPSGGIDHQSVIALPYDRKGESPDLPFFRDLFDYIVNNPDVSIRGGNDNIETPESWEQYHNQRISELERAIKEDDNEFLQKHLSRLREEKLNVFPLEFEDMQEFRALPLEDECKDFRCRKDGEWWTLFNIRTGAKIRLSFSKDPVPYIAASTPELVDLKITDQCPFNCPGCYMSSTPAGSHADYYDIRNIMNRLSAAGVFEVAFGGGEPTIHPNFQEFLSVANWFNLTPNFTSFNMDWAKIKNITKAVNTYCGSFAISSPSQTVLKKLACWNSENSVKGTSQIPLGFYPRKQVENQLNFCRDKDLPVTFLGFKPVGRGANFTPKDYSWLPKFIQEIDLWRFGADTLFIQQFKDQLDDLGVPESLRVGLEGAFSCYIDGVNMQMGPSSYQPERMHPINMDHLLENFPYNQIDEKDALHEATHRDKLYWE